jgi:pimeloyl-ACP methyl ester carboxylesterase
MTDLLFLPGAGASAAFWRPAADRLDLDRRRRFFAWPGLGNEPADANVRGLDDLVAMVLAAIDEPADLIAQSMGGLVAVRVALVAPDKVRRLVLAAASGGVRLDDLGAADWRDEYFTAFPAAARWIGEIREDLSAQLPAIAAPRLLLWGDADPISPLAVGRRLQALLPDARLHVLRGAGHDLAQTHADEAATLIGAHLR